MKITKKHLNTAIVTAIILLTATNLSAMESPEQRAEEKRLHQLRRQEAQAEWQRTQEERQQNQLQQSKTQQQKQRPKPQFINNNNQNQPQQRQNSKFGFVELPMKEMIYYTALTEFYKEYKAQVDQNKSEESIVSFPIRSCDPLPIKTFGGVRWFTTSAISGNRGEHGINFEIVNPSITNVLAVRGKTSNGKAEFYFGYDANNPNFNNGKKKVFQGILLYLVNKQPLYSTENRSVMAFPDVAYLSSRLTNRFEKYLFRQHDGSQIAIDQNFYRELGGAPFECYWTETENKLKGIQYKNNKK
jgi:hypothetical protein